MIFTALYIYIHIYSIYNDNNSKKNNNLRAIFNKRMHGAINFVVVLGNQLKG